MGYERNDRGYGRDTYRGDDRYDRGNPEDRGFFERAGDEVRSWFGDEEAERRRRYDERFDERHDRENPRNEQTGRHAGYSPSHFSGDYPRYDRSNSADRGGYVRDRSTSGFGHATNRDDRNFGYGDDRSSRYGSSVGRDRDWRESEYRALYGRDNGHADRTARHDDPHGYQSWRDQQIHSFDRDYDEYRRENQSRFASEFAAWRETRQTQRASLRQAKGHQEVVGSDGAHVGTVDHIRGDRILLTKTDKDAGGHHHSIPSSWIHSIDEKVHISKTADEAHQAWRDEESNRGLFGTHGQDAGHEPDRGPANLNRSFSGTY